MKKPLDLKRSQSVLEYALIIVAIIGGLVSMSLFMTHGIQGRMKSAADSTGAQFDREQSTSLMRSAENAYIRTGVQATDVNGLATSTVSVSSTESQSLGLNEQIAP